VGFSRPSRKCEHSWYGVLWPSPSDAPTRESIWQSVIAGDRVLYWAEMTSNKVSGTKRETGKDLAGTP